MKSISFIVLTVFALTAAGAALAAENAMDKAKEKKADYEGVYTKARFDKADADNSGALSWEEAVCAGLPFEGQKGRERFNKADKDDDGTMSFKEAETYRNGELSVATSKVKDEKVKRENKAEWDKKKSQYKGTYTKERFDASDKDGDSVLSWDEAVEGGLPFEGSKGKERFNKADKNDDGKLSIGEASAQMELEKKNRGKAKDKLSGE